jgi:hypothetical protein
LIYLAFRCNCGGFGALSQSPGVVTHGHAPTLDEAKAKFRDNWTKAKAVAERG